MEDSNGASRPRWSVVILSAREATGTLESTIDAALRAAGREETTIDVVVNGNPRVAETLAARMSVRAPGTAPVRLRVWTLALRDKAHAWNTYIHALWPGGQSTFFVDGYARASNDALSALQTRLEASRDALAAAAVPTSGRSASHVRAFMLAQPQIHGSLYAIRCDVMERLRTAGFRLPLGLYRLDALLGTLVNFNLDPSAHEWDEARIVVAENATWWEPAKSPWRPRDVAAHLQRLLRQSLGHVEQAAIRSAFYDQRRSARLLPDHSLALVDEWIRSEPAAARRTLALHALARIRMAQLRHRADWAMAAEPPVCLFES